MESRDAHGYLREIKRREIRSRDRFLLRFFFFRLSFFRCVARPLSWVSVAQRPQRGWNSVTHTGTTPPCFPRLPAFACTCSRRVSHVKPTSLLNKGLAQPCKEREGEGGGRGDQPKKHTHTHMHTHRPTGNAYGRRQTHSQKTAQRRRNKEVQ